MCSAAHEPNSPASRKPLSHPTLQVNIAVLRECLQWEFQEAVGPPGQVESDTSSSSGDDDGSSDGEEEEEEVGTPGGEEDGGEEEAAVAAVAAEGDGEADGSCNGGAARGGGSNAAAAAAAVAATAPGGAEGEEVGVTVESKVKPQPPPSFKPKVPNVSFESILDDLVVLTFLAGE